ncbi:MAG: DUF1292 domain-containing protein [Clostridium sp.]|nr:DUF1292 domain-containing protein [Acetatifactor muris]MCM1528154.1 DUF1292 domain-containing protein [Bacteroides sp.]MCM1562749.1 DUF1292 domain-containing protein [Clostridium sp.]
MSKLEKITFNADGEDPVDFYVLEQTRIGGTDYILVTDFEEGDGEALILKDMSSDGEEESLFAIVSDEQELEAVAGVFADMLEDVEFVQDND